MLVSLSVQNIVLIDQLRVDWSEGLTVLTGETGAGKSIILDSLSLSLGTRGDGGLVRSGCDQGQVSAAFDLPPNHMVFSLLEENGVSHEGELVLRRVQKADGRTRAYINDEPVGAALLRSVGSQLVEIHGQHADRALVDAAEHRSLVDAFGGLESQVEQLATYYDTWQELQVQASDLAYKIEEADKEREYMTACLEELMTIQPEVGEEEELSIRRQKMMGLEKIASDVNSAFEALDGQSSPIPSLSGLLRQLERKADQAPGLLDGAMEQLSAALDGLDNTHAALRDAMREIDFDPTELEMVEERLFALRQLGRKHKVAVDDLTDLMVQFEAAIQELATGQDRLAGLRSAEAEAFALYDQAAKALSVARGHASEAVANAVMSELPALKLEAAQFFVQVDVDESRAQREGYDRLEFQVQTNPGTKPGSIMKVASGGELSRFLLALKVSLADKGSAPTLIFDEIDAGVGGAVAEAIGQRLARLSAGVQVLSITHAPQVAARAKSHFLISKKPLKDGGAISTRLIALDEQERGEEVARMLAGETITDEARAAAKKLMATG